MTLDTSHCASKGIDPLSFFKENAALINNIHLSNFRGWQCHRQLWDGVVDMGRFLKAVSRHSYSGTLTLEINQEAESGIMKAVSFIKKNI
jgi:sugar phosphate isomerase/epimerase